MSEEILINVTPRETRVALVENGVAQELFIERAHKRGIVGNIYKGKVSRVLPGMQAAFIDIGLDRAAFLHASDIIKCPNEELESVARDQQTITDLLSESQDILVQVIKDPLGSKGARLTTCITIPSRYLVLLPNENTIGVSTKIENEDERRRLKEIVSALSEASNGQGYIIRTAGEGVSEQELALDQQFLTRLWQSTFSQIPEIKSGSILYEDLPLAVRTLRDIVNDDIEKIRVDSKETYQRLKEFAGQLMPVISERLEYYPGERPIFDLYGVEDEIQRAIARKVPLKSGGYLIFDQTEAMTTVDVNTGAFVGHRNLEETIYKTNLEAAQSLVRQLRLRNIGGIIIIDFIDMMMEEHKRQVLRSLEKYLERDHAKSQITEVSALGLVEMTRKRTRESLEHILCEPCSVCEGRGSIKSAETVCFEIFREIIREARQYEADKLLVLASQSVVDMLVDEESSSLAELESFIKVPIRFQVEAMYTQEQYDVVPM